MNHNREWVPLEQDAAENTGSLKKVVEISERIIEPGGLFPPDHAPPRTVRRSVRFDYEPAGFWRSDFQFLDRKFIVYSIPGAGATPWEGRPQVPQEGVFVAVPKGAENIAARVISKTTRNIHEPKLLRPAPKPITEKEYIEGQEEYRPRPEDYNSDRPFPGRDFDLLGLRSFHGLTVAHVMIYPLQYMPMAHRLVVARRMTLEITYEAPEDSERLPSVPAMLKDLVIPGTENIPGHGEQEFDGGSAGCETHEDEGAEVDTGAAPSPVTSTSQQAAPKLKRPDNASRYVIITSASLIDEVQALLDSKAGPPYHAMVASREDIVDEFPAAGVKESIRSFLRWALDNWRMKPEFVVLAGDVNVIPTHKRDIDGRPACPSDHYYADLNDDMGLELVVARLPASAPNDMNAICGNLAAYPALHAAGSGNWTSNVLLVAHEAPKFTQCSDRIETAIGGIFTCSKLHGDSSTSADVVDAINAGALAVNFRGHGDQISWISTNGISVGNVKNLQNHGMPPLVFCICCDNADLDRPGSTTFAETFLKKGKSVAVLGASRPSPHYPNDVFDEYLWQAVLDGLKTAGEVVGRAKAKLIQQYGNSEHHMRNIVIYILFGDPTAEVF